MEYIIISEPARLKKISREIFSIARKIYDWSAATGGKLIFSGLKASPGIAKMMGKYIEPMEYYMNLEESGRDLILHMDIPPGYFLIPEAIRSTRVFHAASRETV